MVSASLDGIAVDAAMRMLPQACTPLPPPMTHASFKRLGRLLSVLIASSFIAGCASSGPHASDLDERLLGVWQIDGGATYTITAPDGQYALSIVDFDDEVFEVESVSWAEGVLSWSYLVPSSGTRVSEVTTRISADQVEVSWENSAGNTGTDLLNRVD